MTIHALERAKHWYNLDLTFDDLREILSTVLEGDCKEIFYPKNMFGIPPNSRVFHLRYQKKLVEPVIVEFDTNPRIVTFMATGKKALSFKRFCDTKIDKDFTQRKKRLRKEK